MKKYFALLLIIFITSCSTGGYYRNKTSNKTKPVKHTKFNQGPAYKKSKIYGN